jgi:aminomethyltransferase
MRQTKQRDVPVNLRQSGYSDQRMLIGTRVRKSPFWHRSVEHGCRAVTVYNKMYHPRLYFSEEEGGLMGEYRYLTEHVTLWNVAVERQIRLKGPDALRFANVLVTRELEGKLPVNQARYVVLCNQDGNIVNDPVMLRVAEDEIWLSISDSDVVLWAQGLNYGLGYDVDIREIDVSPVQVQGPKSTQVMRKLFGETVDELKYYKLWRTELDGMRLVVSRTGFSAERGYEIYLYDATRDADRLWDLILEAGEAHNIRVIAPGHIRRIEAGILSYGQDMDLETNPFEVGLDWQVDLDKDDFVGKQALAEIKRRGVSRKLVGLRFGGHRVTWYNADFWPVQRRDDGADVGYVTSAFFSPKLDSNIALAMVPLAYAEVGTALQVALPGEAEPVGAEVAEVPFYDPGKRIPAA